MIAYLVRHALAGDGRGWEGPDERRPLTQRGRRQAQGLVALLGERGIERIVSSPRDRCTQTVEPLAEHLGLAVRTHEALDQDPVDVDVAIAFVLANTDVPTAHCSHREVISEVMERLTGEGLAYDGDLVWAKGSVWELEAEAGVFVRGVYLPPAE